MLESNWVEYVFTDQSLIKIDRTDTEKEVVKRWDWQLNTIDNVRFETPAGFSMLTEFACTIKFILSGKELSIDIHKDYMNTARQYYLVLTKLSREQKQNSIKLKTAETILSSNSKCSTKIDQSMLYDLSPISYKNLFEASSIPCFNNVCETEASHDGKIKKVLAEKERKEKIE